MPPPTPTDGGTELDEIQSLTTKMSIETIQAELLGWNITAEASGMTNRWSSFFFWCSCKKIYYVCKLCTRQCNRCLRYGLEPPRADAIYSSSRRAKCKMFLLRNDSQPGKLQKVKSMPKWDASGQNRQPRSVPRTPQPEKQNSVIASFRPTLWNGSHGSGNRISLYLSQRYRRDV